MRRRIAVALILIVLGVGMGLAGLGMLPLRLDLGLSTQIWKRQAAKTAPAAEIGVSSRQGDEARTSPPPAAANVAAGATDKQAATADDVKTTGAANGETPKVALDVARISRDGPSVFAGKTEPFAQVTVLEGGKEVATATANASGDWSVAVEHEFTGADPEINLRAISAEAATRLAEASSQAVGAKHAAPAEKREETPPSIRLLKEFEDVVANARKEAKQRDVSGIAAAGSTAPPDAQALASSTPQAEARPSDVAEVATTATKPAAAATTTPVPITFVYDQTTLTPEGRGAFRLLLEYLNLKKFDAVTLSGHADERGSPGYNMDLSQQRLDAISRLLRNGGYRGKVDLQPKGAAEPFLGVDRSKYGREDLLQLDRRVELRVAN